MASNLPQRQREDLRFAAREQLVAAKTVALDAEMIRRRVERSRLLDFSVTTADVEDALALLTSLGHANSIPSELGATRYYQATAAGVLAHERGSP